MFHRLAFQVLPSLTLTFSPLSTQIWSVKGCDMVTPPIKISFPSSSFCLILLTITSETVIIRRAGKLHRACSVRRGERAADEGRWRVDDMSDWQRHCELREADTSCSCARPAATRRASRVTGASACVCRLHTGGRRREHGNHDVSWRFDRRTIPQVLIIASDTKVRSGSKSWAHHVSVSRCLTAAALKSKWNTAILEKNPFLKLSRRILWYFYEWSVGKKTVQIK